MHIPALRNQKAHEVQENPFREGRISPICPKKLHHKGHSDRLVQEAMNCQLSSE
jgi:hypothetical protein